MTPCRLGYVEHDGFQYCHEHGGWVHYVTRSMRCDRAALAGPNPRGGQDGGGE